jgi:hypothetical protein
MIDLPGEKKLLSSSDDRLVLTTHRVRFEARARGFSRTTSIMLEEVSACEIASTSKPWLIAVGILALFIGFYLATPRDDQPKAIGLAVAAVCVLAYVATRRQVISVRSSGGAINVPTRGMGLDKAKEFIDHVELAKNRCRIERAHSAGA